MWSSTFRPSRRRSWSCAVRTTRCACSTTSVVIAGDKLVQTPSGCRRAFTCGFHAWTYSNTGNLIGITDASQFPGIEKEQFGLLTVRSEVWESLVYVNFDPEAESLRDWMGETYDQYSGFAKDRVKVSDHRIVMRTNWNLAVSAFCEGYHNLYIHRNTVPDYQGGTTNPNRHRAYLEVGRRFGRYSAFGNPDHKPTPAEGLLYRHSRPLFPSFPPVDPASLPAGVNPSRFPRWAFDLAPMFPNFVLITQANMHGFMWFWPIDHNHTDIRVMRFAFASNKPADLIAQAHSRVRVREILREDLATMETNYEGWSPPRCRTSFFRSRKC